MKNGAKKADRADPARATEWWRELQDDRATRARLARAAVSHALADDSVHDLYRRLGYRREEVSWRLMRVAALACVLAKVRNDEPSQTFGRQIGRPFFGDDGGAAVSMLRFKRLMKARTEDEIVRGFRRAVLIVKGKANVRDLAGLILTWDSDAWRARFAFDYYCAPEAAPAGDQFATAEGEISV